MPRLPDAGRFSRVASSSITRLNCNQMIQFDKGVVSHNIATKQGTGRHRKYRVEHRKMPWHEAKLYISSVVPAIAG